MWINKIKMNKLILMSIFGLFLLNNNMVYAQAEVEMKSEQWRLGHVTPPSHIWHKVSVRFGENIKKISNNQKNIKIYPLSKLGGDDQMVQLLQSGAIQFAILTAGNLSNRSPSMNAWFLPYTFDSMEEATAAVRSPEARQLLQDLEQNQLVGLGYSLAGMRHVITTQTIDNMSNFKNQKIRSFPNPLFNIFWRKLDAAPTALAISDVMPSLTTNLINGVDADLDIVVGMKMYHQAPNLTLTNHMAFPGVMVVSKKFWDKLSDTQRQQIREAFSEAEEWGLTQQNQQEKNNIEVLKKAGVNITTPNYLPELKAIGRAVSENYIQKMNNPHLQTFYQRFSK